MKYDPATCHPFDEECPKCGSVIQEAGAPVCDDCDPELQSQRRVQDSKSIFQEMAGAEISRFVATL